MHKDYNMTQYTLPMETSVLIPTNDISWHVNDIVETIPRLNSMNSFVLTIKDYDLIDMPIIMIKMVLNETLNNMNVMIVPNVLWNINEWTSIQNK